MSKEIRLEYDGRYPNLCSGTLIVTLGGKRWDFGSHCLESGGNVWFDKEWSEHVDQGPWTVSRWPEGFPAEEKDAVTQAVNDQVAHGCCGGCV